MSTQQNTLNPKFDHFHITQEHHEPGLIASVKRLFGRAGDGPVTLIHYVTSDQVSGKSDTLAALSAAYIAGIGPANLPEQITRARAGEFTRGQL